MDLLKAVVAEVDQTCASFESIIKTVEESKQRLAPLMEMDMPNQELLRDVIPKLSQEQASSLMRGLLILFDLVPPKGPHQ